MKRMRPLSFVGRKESSTLTNLKVPLRRKEKLLLADPRETWDSCHEGYALNRGKMGVM